MKKKTQNGRWTEAYIAEVLAYAKKYYNAEAIRKFNVPASTFYGWLRDEGKAPIKRIPKTFADGRSRAKQAEARRARRGYL